MIVPVIVTWGYLAASQVNHIAWNPLDPGAIITIKRSPAFTKPLNPNALDATNFYDQQARSDTAYTYTVCSTLNGETECSLPETIEASGVTDPKKPAAPTIVTAQQKPQSIKIYWQSSQHLQPYHVIYGRDGAAEEPQVDVDSGDQNGSWETPSTLQPDTNYHFRIQGDAGGLLGWSNWSPDAHIRTAKAPPAPPPVATVSLKLAGNGLSVDVSFNGVPGATHAKIFRFRKGSANAEAEYDANANSASFTDANLAPFVTYGYRLESLGSGIDVSSDASYITTFYNAVVKNPTVFSSLPFTPLATASWGSDRLDVVYAAPDHDIKRQAWDVENWLPGNTGWQSLGNWTMGNPTVVATPPLGSTVFVLGQDSSVYSKDVAGSYAPADWEPLGGTSLTVPVGISASPGRLDIFIVGTDNQIYQKTRSSGSWLPSQNGWSPLGGYTSYPPVVISSGPGKIDLFVAGVDQAVYHKAWNGTQWLPSVGGWDRIDGTIIGAPAAISWGPGRIDLFVLGADFSIYQRSFDNGTWLPAVGWQPMGATAMGPPALASWGPGRLDLFIIGTDYGIYHKAWDGSQWVPSQTGWEAVGGNVYGDSVSVSMPSVVSWGPGRLDLFVMGTDSAVYQKALIGDQWVPANGWVAHGGQVKVGN